MYNRRAFLARSAGMVGGLTLVSSVPLLTSCGDDSTATSDSTGSGDSTTPGVTGTVATQFNWVPDIEWAAWYLAESKGYFANHGVTSKLGHGGPNTPAVVQILAAGDGNVGLSTSELDITRANAEGSDFVIVGAMYQRNPLGFTWMTETGIESAADLVGLRIGGPQGDQVQIEAVLAANDLPIDYEFVPMGYDPQPLADGEMDVITSYVTNQPIQLELQGYDVTAKPYADFGLPSYGDLIFASKAWITDNRELLVGYLGALLEGVAANRADPTEAVGVLVDTYGAEAEISEEYATAANPAYIDLMDSPYTDANGLLSIDPDKMANEIYPALEAAGETDLPPVDELLDTSILQEAHDMMS